MGVLRVRHFQWLSQDSKPYSCACIILKPSTAVWALNLNLKSTWSVFRQNNSQTLSSLSGFVDMHNRNSGTLSNALVLLAKHAIPPNPHASFWSQRRYFFLATKSQSTRQIFFSNGGTTCEQNNVQQINFAAPPIQKLTKYLYFVGFLILKSKATAVFGEKFGLTIFHLQSWSLILRFSDPVSFIFM